MPTASDPVNYTLRCLNHGGHLFEVTCRVDVPDPQGQVFTLPAWIPGSYLVRDFARNIVRIEAQQGARGVAVTKLDKSTWRCAPADGPLVVRIEVYAHDLSVRGAWLDDRRAFFNGTSVFLLPRGLEDRRCELEIEPPRGDGFGDWQVETTMRAVDVDAQGYGRYAAADYDELIDHPVEIGPQDTVDFDVAGVPHRFAVSGRHDADLDRVAADLARICTVHVDLFGRPPPMSRYLFTGLATGDGYGGLEHRASTALMFRRADLPRRGEHDRVDEGYRRLLGLCSHEYFHTWNVKRIRPAAFTPYELSAEAYTRLLWVFEGITSYYDDLALRRAGVIDDAAYLELLAQTITRVQRGAGRQVQSIAESSFDAWIKFYKPDENTPNAVVSYYAKGALVALALDLTIRRGTAGERSLDDVMRALWQRHGLTGEGVAEDGFERLAAEVSGLDLDAFFARTVRGTSELPLKALLSDVGVLVEWRPATSGADPGGTGKASGDRRAWLGAALATVEGRLQLGTLTTGSPAQQAGLSAGDELVALDGLKITPATLDALLGRRRPGDRVELTAFRRDELIRRDVTLGAAPLDTCVLTADADAEPARLAARRAWLQP